VEGAGMEIPLPSLCKGILWPQLPFSFTDPHSLCLHLTVKSQSRPRHLWYEVQGSVTKKPFLQYDSDSSKIRPLGLLGQKVNATKAWTQLTQPLGEVGQELRMILPDIKLENNMTRAPPTLDNQLCCQHEAQWCPTVFWRFSINGQATLLFGMMNVTWTVMNPGARGIKEEWEDEGLANYFRRISMGYCNHWLREFLEHWEKVLEPPVLAPSINVSEPKSSSIRETPTWQIYILICPIAPGL
uniref:Retinoic acid early-inducible protein 1 domain-containing protein n=1 Tax=Mustela putorius furo TaxID=9669 RepID=M3Z307_MUSPF